ncbi:helix-turn-helix domain-containing protein, partial [Streptomyces sparsus]
MERVELCAGVVCRRRESTGEGRRRAFGGSRLCPACQGRLSAEIRQLPRLHAACEDLLGGGRTGPAERTSGGHLPGMPFNEAACEARWAILGTLGGWAGLVAEQRGLRPPERAPNTLADFLGRHLAWLAGHGAVHELTAEISQLVRRARRVVDPDPVRRVPVGACAEPGCAGTLAALVRPDAPGGSAEIRCDADPEHRWAGHEWTRLGLRMRQSAAGHRGTPARVGWLSAAEIARLWDVPPGSVYRLASERGWRRRSEGGRTRYHEADVTAA